MSLLLELEMGREVSLVCLLSQKRIGEGRTGKVYGLLTLKDKSGEVNATVWNNAEEMLSSLNPGDPIRVTGRMGTYNGLPQFKVKYIEFAPQIDPNIFLAKSPVNRDDLDKRFVQLISSIHDKNLKKILDFFFKDSSFYEKFSVAPAAKSVHHDYVNGLLEHTICVGEMAVSVSERYSVINRDILLCGALLHDVGKVLEFSMTSFIDYTDEGRFLGHITLGVELLNECLSKLSNFPSKLALHLRHLILSHHGFYEFGSPKKPKTLEALILHMLDDLDAKIVIFQKIIEKNKYNKSDWSPYNQLLERFVYTKVFSFSENENENENENEEMFIMNKNIFGLLK